MELGGANYNGMEPKSYDADGRELPGSGGYKYFGAAKELPGVRELFQAEAPEPPRRTRGDMYVGGGGSRASAVARHEGECCRPRRGGEREGGGSKGR